MNKHNIPISEDTLTSTDEFIQEELFCCLCGSELEFKHSLDFAKNTIQEDSHCPQCHIDLKQKEHTLH
jgi:hypothetical protein